MPNSIKSKLKNLEERLQAENHDRDNLDMYEQNLTASRGEPANGERAIAAPPMGGMRQTPTLPMGNSNGGSITGRTRSRPIMNLPVPSGHPAATETDTDKKLRKIMKQTGILTVDGHPYKTDIKDLEHLGDLGSGTSGNVVKMRHKPSGTVIAVKQMRRTGNTEENKRILMDLDVVLKSHDCDYIVQCLGCFVHDPDVWICMELMSMCFDKLLKLSKQPVPEPILGKVTVATVKALWYLKDMHGVIHRDVKPSNILIDERGKIKLCDFGISGRLVDSKANTRSAGCAAYMAPERIDPKKPKYDIRADVWSLGITLVELATARSPYEGCKTDFEVLTKVLDSEPPSLPHGDGFHFSQEFREFVNKCLTKNPQMRPKYPELLEQPFIRRYENTDVDVPTWFQHIRTQHRLGGSGGVPPPLMPAITTMTTKFHRSSIKQSTTTTSNTSTAPPLTSMPGATQQQQQHMTALITTINPPKPLATHIPSYQQQAQQSTNLQQQQLPQRYHGSKEMARGHLPEMHQPSQLPQPIGGGNYQHHQAKERENGHTRLYSSGVGGGGGGGGSGSSSSATSLSPQSPPSVTTTAQSELSRLYRKSPFTQRKYGGGSFKYNNSGTGNGTAGGAESPKKESVLSSIGQSIIRNLTTSPFAQKKHSHNMQPSNPQPNQVEPLWRMPSGSQDLDFADGAVAPTKIKTFGMDSPFAARKRYTAAENDGAATGPLASRQEQQQSLPLNRNDINSASPRIVQGNQSPIVLQRFYHQQQQLREKELEKERLQQHQQQILYPQTTTNPFLSSYNHSAATTTGHHHHHAQHQHQQSHIPVPSSSSSAIYMASSSSQSTSSQSSTQSTSSQINTYELRRKYENVSPPPMLLPVASASSASSAFDSPSPTKPHSPLTAAPIFGVGSSHLQYQPLPSQQQQQLPQQLYRHTAKLEPASVPLQDMQHHDYLEAAGEGLSKLEKLYGRRASSSQGNSSDSGIGSGGVGVGSAGHGDKDGSTSNTVGGATQLYNPRPGQDKESPTSSSSQKSHFYRSISSSGSANTSPSSLAEPLGPPHPLSKIPCSSDFHEGSGAGPFLRRYANGAMGGSPHLLSGLDRRHRSPDPPPRYNRGQSPLLLRKNLLELSGQPPGVSPMMQRRYVSASPPLPPPRRGSESVPGSPQHFRTRIHYTPEPQRRIYRTIDQ